VAKVDEVRAESMAKALGVPMADLFGEPQVKGNGKAKAEAEPKAGPAQGKEPTQEARPRPGAGFLVSRARPRAARPRRDAKTRASGRC